LQPDAEGLLRTASRRRIDDDHRGFQHLGVGRKLVAFEDALTHLLSGSKAGILYNEHIAEDGAVVFARLQPRRLGDRVEARRRALPIRPVFGTGQGAHSGERRGAAGAEREVEQMRLAPGRPPELFNPAAELDASFQRQPGSFAAASYQRSCFQQVPRPRPADN